MTPNDQPLRVGFVAIGRKRPGFDPEWGREMTLTARETCEAIGLDCVAPETPIVDDRTLRTGLAELRNAGCETLLVLQPTMGDGRLALILAQLWDDPLVLWATPERPDSPRVSSCSLVGAHAFASVLRQLHRPFELVYSPSDEEAAGQQLRRAARLTAAAARLRRSKVGLIGYHAPGFINMHADPVALSDCLGVELHHFGLDEFLVRIQQCDEQELEDDRRRVLDLGLPMDRGLIADDLVPNSSYYLAMSSLAGEENLDAMALRCWPELPNRLGHWPYLAMMRLAEESYPVALEGDVDGAVLGLLGKLLGMGVGYLSDWLEHDDRSITLWHPGHAPREICVPESLRLGRHFNNNLPLVLNGQLAADRPITLARLWRCDGQYRLAAFSARTETPRRTLLGASGTAVVEGVSVFDLFEDLCHAGMPHHVSVFQGDHVDTLRRAARLIGLEWHGA